jgi:hypothetical protein
MGFYFLLNGKSGRSPDFGFPAAFAACFYEIAANALSASACTNHSKVGFASTDFRFPPCKNKRFYIDI